MKCIICFSISFHWYAFLNFCMQICPPLAGVHESPQKLVWSLNHLELDPIIISKWRTIMQYNVFTSMSNFPKCFTVELSSVFTSSSFIRSPWTGRTWDCMEQNKLLKCNICSSHVIQHLFFVGKLTKLACGWHSQKAHAWLWPACSCFKGRLFLLYCKGHLSIN